MVGRSGGVSGEGEGAAGLKIEEGRRRFGKGSGLEVEYSPQSIRSSLFAGLFEALNQKAKRSGKIHDIHGGWFKNQIHHLQ